MGTITIDVALLLKIAGAIVTLGGAYAVLSKAAAPIRKPLAELEVRVDKLEKYADRDNDRFKELEELTRENTETLKVVLKSMKAVVGHLRDNNHTNEMAEVEELIDNFLIDKK